MNKYLTTLLAIVLFVFSQNRIDGQYPFIRYDLNTITLPHDSSAWFGFARKFENAKNQGSFKILHFGDSHIQGDYFTGQVRKHLFNYFDINPRSRGITMPYKVAGTNGPDELFSKAAGIIDHSSVRKGAPNYYALTGYCITTSDSLITINLRDTSAFRFNRVFLFHSSLTAQKIRLNNAEPSITINISDSLNISEFKLEDLNASLDLQILHSSLNNKTSIYGISLENTHNNICYHSVGINGATYNSFLSLHDSPKIVGFINPDCIVFSYGTNEALNHIDSARLSAQITSVISIIRSTLPDVPIILTTPGDFLINKRHVNPRTTIISKVIKETAVANNCAYWDFYAVMGGSGSVRDWYRHQLMFVDWIHLSKKGYRLQGDLFFDALLNLKDIKANE